MYEKFALVILGMLIGILLTKLASRLSQEKAMSQKKRRDRHLALILRQDGIEAVVSDLMQIKDQHGRPVFYNTLTKSVLVDRALKLFDPLLVAAATGAILRWVEINRLPDDVSNSYKWTAMNLLGHQHKTYAIYLASLVGRRHSSVGERLTKQLQSQLAERSSVVERKQSQSSQSELELDARACFKCPVVN
jgi:hypothetical protein